ncbi:AIG2-like family-domain-containing protein [Coniochaeta sp. 2T2.1]|nr:AIG2-like family-domain-containing protein [Coniochaeta sp. 2T2.1]
MTDTATTEPKSGKDKLGKETHRAFFYGTLMASEVFFTVCYGTKNIPDEVAKRHTFTPAILHGYCRRRVKGAAYPGVIPDEKHQVFGTYATGLSNANMRRLDGFEGSEYFRKTVKVKLLTHVGNAKGEGNVEGEEREAGVYVFKHPEELEDKEWDLEEFRREEMEMWTRNGVGFNGGQPYVPSDHPSGVW